MSRNYISSYFTDYAKKFEKLLLEQEDKGWYNSVRQYALKWLKYLEKIANFHDKPGREEIRNEVRAYYTKIEDWIGRLDRKYDSKIQIDAEKTPLINEEIKEKIVQYKIDRKNFKETEIKRRILSFLRN